MKFKSAFGPLKLVMIASSVLLTSCATEELISTPRTNSVEPVNKSLEMLEESIAQSEARAKVPVPQSVDNALMPGFTSKSRRDRDREARFEISANQLEAKDFFRGLVKGTPFNMVVHPDVKGKISLELNNVTIDEVMRVTRDLYGYDYKYSGGLYQVLPGGLRTEIFQIDYLNIKRTGRSRTTVSSGQVSQNNGRERNSSNSLSTGRSNNRQSTNTGTLISTETTSDFWMQLEKTLTLLIGNGEGRSLVVTPNAGVVVVKAAPKEIRAVEEYLEKTELIMQRQIVLEAKIMEVFLNDSFEQGIDWSYMKEYSVDAAGNASKALISGVAGEPLIPGETGGVFSAALQISDFTAAVQLLSTQGDVQVLSSPRIAALNNQKAVIKVGNDEYFVTDIEIDRNNNISSGERTSSSVELTPFFSGISFDVTPQISKDGDITLHIHPTISDVKDQEKTVTIDDRDVTLPLAFSTVRETDSIVTARNGQVVVIGGLIQNVAKDDNASVPFFSSIPVLGEAFKQKRYKAEKSELVILLRPILADDREYQNIMKKTSKRMGEIRDEMLKPADFPYEW